MDKKKKDFTERIKRTTVNYNSSEKIDEAARHNEQIHKLEISSIKDNPNQPRKIFEKESLKALAASIKEQGVLQPILVRFGDRDEIYLVAGERRLLASTMCGNKTIPAIFTTGKPIEVSLIENILRENLNPIEEAEAFQNMIDNHNYTQQRLANILGKSKSLISASLSINKLSQEIKDRCVELDISKRELVRLSRIDDEKILSQSLSDFEKRSTNKISDDRKTKKNSNINKSKVEKIADTIKQTTKKISKVEKVSEAEKMLLLNELNEMKNKIDHLEIKKS